jgi:hypothetical protein
MRAPAENFQNAPHSHLDKTQLAGRLCPVLSR